jgi:valyl-tRNA synthetase
MEKTYNHKDVEDKWYSFWEKNKFFTPNLNSEKPPFSMVIPPPNVTGSLHMGHALNNTIQDIVARFMRMKGFEVLWVPGTDHAGIATQNVVERELAKEGLSREKIGREEFVKRVWKWKEEYGSRIIYQLKKLGCSCDWTRERFTMDKGLSRAVKEVFIKLYKDGLIYRGDYIINWCPRCKTALADIEVEQSQENGKLYYIKYPLEEGGHLTVATTRPETMLGDTALAVNPDDERYFKYHGKYAILPIIKRKIPIITHSYVEKEFGTGVLKVTPAHDFTDFEIAKVCNLPSVKVIDEDGKMTEAAGEFKGLDRFEAREKIVERLLHEGLFERTENYELLLGRCYRCKTVVEPLLSKQWFVKTKPLAEEALKAVREGRTVFIPEMWTAGYYHWLENIRDWCVSRQIWWGHRIPAYHCSDCGNIMVRKVKPRKCSSCKGMNIREEEDVLDTWFSSALWPFSTLGWPGNTRELKIFYPTSLLVTGFDIITFWVARMMMMGLYIMKDVPFRKVYIHALVRDAEGQKMSKTKGNVIDPLDMMEKYGTDALRFTLTAMTAQGRDIKLSEQRIEGYKHFINKIWNASRFIFTSGKPSEEEITPLTLADKWILTRLNETIEKAEKSLEKYEFNIYAQEIYNFLWKEFCDWYIEIAKYHVYKDDEIGCRNTSNILFYVLEKFLRLAHPVIPFVTEEIWQRIPPHFKKKSGSEKSIMIAHFPEKDGNEFKREAEIFEKIKKIVTTIRNIKTDYNIKEEKRVHCKIWISEDIEKEIKEALYIVSYLTGVECEVVLGKPEKEILNTVIREIEDMAVGINIEGLIINIENEIKRAQAELNEAEEELSFLMKKLSNENFISKAPQDVIKKTEEEANLLSQKVNVLKEKIKILSGMKGA